MTATKTALLLVGSAKPTTSTSLSLGTALLDRLTAKGFTGDTVRIAKALKNEEATQALLQQLDTADVVILAAPLYVDSLPAPAISLFERYAAHHASRAAATGNIASIPGTQHRLTALLNCGFPENTQCSTALDICRLFARDAGFDWAGGLGLAMGGSIDGRPIEKSPAARTVVPALDLAAAALADGDSIPPQAVAKAAKPPMPKFLYVMMANLGWRVQARGKTGGLPLKYRPHADAETRA